MNTHLVHLAGQAGISLNPKLPPAGVTSPPPKKATGPDAGGGQKNDVAQASQTTQPAQASVSSATSANSGAPGPKSIGKRRGQEHCEECQCGGHHRPAQHERHGSNSPGHAGPAGHDWQDDEQLTRARGERMAMSSLCMLEFATLVEFTAWKMDALDCFAHAACS